MRESKQTLASRYKHYALDIKRYYRIPAVQKSLSLVLSLFITAFFIIAAIRPTFITIASLQKSIVESEKVLTQLNTKVRSLEQAQRLWEENMGKIAYVDSSIPTTKADYDSYIKTIEIIALESQVFLEGTNLGDALLYSSIFDPYTGTEREGITLPVTISVSGTYPQIIQFYKSLTSLDRLLDPLSVTLATEGKQGKEQQGQISMSLSGNIQYMASKSLLEKALPGKEKR